MARLEKDSLGEIEVPENVLYGAFTTRASRNFKNKRYQGKARIYQIDRAHQKSAAIANMKLGVLDKKTGMAIVTGC